MWRRLSLWMVWLVLSSMLFSCSPPDSPAKGAGKNVGKGAKKSAHRVAVIHVEPASMSAVSVRTGRLKARRILRVFNQGEGQVTQLTLYPADRVKTGDLLARLDDGLLQAELQKVQAVLQQGKADLARTRQLAQKDLASRERLLRDEINLKSAQAEESLIRTRLSYMTLRAPWDGVVTERLVEPGDAIPRFTHLLTIMDHESLYVETSVPELLLSSLSPEDRVQVVIDALGDTPCPAQVARVYPVVDPRTRQGLVEVDLHPVPSGAAPGQMARVHLESRATTRIMVPFSALQYDREGPFVFVVDPDSKAQRRPVHTGLRQGDAIEILTGLSGGDRVVTRGVMGLAPGTVVAIAKAEPDSAAKPAPLPEKTP